jgi:hypothetical protein
VVRGARFSVEVGADGETRVEVQQGSAEVQVDEEAHSLAMGERLTVGPGGEVTRESVMEPNAELIQARIEEAWNAPGATFQVELPEGELNQFLAAMGGQTGFPVKDPQIWLTGDEGRIFATLTEPTEFDLSATFEIQVVDGRLEPQIRVGAGGLPVPVPGPVLDLALRAALGPLEGYQDEAFQYVEFTDVQIQDGRILAVGKKQPNAPAP